MKWNDVYDIACELADNYPDIDPRGIRFTDLHNWSSSCLDSTTIPIGGERRYLRQSSRPGLTKWGINPLYHGGPGRHVCFSRVHSRVGLRFYFR